MIGLSLSLSIGTRSAGGGAYDYVIDATSGSDSNDGSPESPWASLSKITAGLLGAGERTAVLVKSGTYDTASDYVNVTTASDISAASLIITFEPGCVADGTAANASAARDGFEFGGNSPAWSAEVNGNGLIVQNYDFASPSSPNGFGNRGNNTLTVRDAHVDNCTDGFSAHANATMIVHDSSAKGGKKSAYAHVDSANFYAYNSVFEGAVAATSGIGTNASATASTYLENCDLIPATSGQSLYADNTTLVRCRIGTLDKSAAITNTNNIPGTMTDCFVNVFIDGDREQTLRRCFGKLTTRIRSGGTVDIQHSVFSAPATGQTAIIIGTTDLGGSKLTFSNNIAETTTAAAFMNVNATNAGYIVAEASEFHNNCLSGSAVYDADLIAADTSGSVRAGSITADALIGAANTMLMADYAFGDGSPCIGAGAGGSNIGFGQEQVVAVGVS